MPSPSKIMSSGVRPVAEVKAPVAKLPANAPPLSAVSYSSCRGVKLPSLVLLRKITLSPSIIPNTSGNVNISVRPLPIIVVITVPGGAINLPLGCGVTPSYKL